MRPEIRPFLFISPVLHKLFNSFVPKSGRDVEPLNNVELHGSFLVFSPIYIEWFDGLDERTFLYCEEEFLFARCYFNKLKTRFNPQIQIIHNEVETNDSSVLKIRKKRLFRVRNCLKSLSIYRKALKNGSFQRQSPLAKPLTMALNFSMRFFSKRTAFALQKSVNAANQMVKKENGCLRINMILSRVCFSNRNGL